MKSTNKSKKDNSRLGPASWLMIVAVGMLLLGSAALSAFAADKDCKDIPKNCFGDYALAGKAPVSTLSGKDPDWSGSLQDLVYYNKDTKIYTYVYRLELNPNSLPIAWVWISYAPWENGKSYQPFDKTLDWGVVKDKNGDWTSKGVDDCGDTGGVGCYKGEKRGFIFSDRNFTVYCANLATQRERLRISFYAQSKYRPPASDKYGRGWVFGWDGDNSKALPAKSDDQSTQLVPPIALRVYTTGLPDGRVELGYGPFNDGLQVVAIGGYEPYTWSITAGNLPNGLKLDPKTGVIAGKPTAPGTFNFTMQVQDSDNPPATSTRDFTITVLPI